MKVLIIGGKNKSAQFSYEMGKKTMNAKKRDKKNPLSLNET